MKNDELDAATVEPVAWIEFADNGNIRFWTSNPARAWTEGDNGRPLRKFTLAELVALVASPRLDRERLARIVAEIDDQTIREILSCKDVGSGRASIVHALTAIMRETR